MENKSVLVSLTLTLALRLPLFKGIGPVCFAVPRLVFSVFFRPLSASRMVMIRKIYQDDHGKSNIYVTFFCLARAFSFSSDQGQSCCLSCFSLGTLSMVRLFLVFVPSIGCPIVFGIQFVIGQRRSIVAFCSYGPGTSVLGALLGALHRLYLYGKW